MSGMKSKYMKPVIIALNNVGMPANLVGYEYTKTALCLALENKGMIFNRVMNLYKEVGEVHNVNKSRAERNIRHAIETTFNRMSPDVQKEYFGGCVLYNEGRVRNAEFLGIMAEKIRMDLGEYDV